MLSNNCKRNVNDGGGMAISKNHRKNLYIRCVHPMLALSPASYRVFAEDVPLILKKNNPKLIAKHMRILNVQNRTWRKKDGKSLNFTLSLEQLDEFLDQFDCDNNLLTDYYYSRTKSREEFVKVQKDSCFLKYTVG
ncbi:hypothetical protein GCK72_022666 [Caenorhabditis remanei]|uniref:Uncharacterized protein n=1 Tax=Caenorhabditis remanei TaxID=31234 RepID=A0A6A5FUJ7_CAERE|nr:hypothetical protein GCK72_022666 [Caenorhabditis remanei]KAF1746213.1 hypothetical protein GCK72_022666 [Caenorhabditis remanei]